MASDKELKKLLRGDAAVKADRYMVRLASKVFLAAALISLFLYFDKPVAVDSIEGRIISMQPVPNGYRSLVATTRVAVQLPNGTIFQKKILNAKVGQIVKVTVYERKITGMAHYR